MKIQEFAKHLDEPREIGKKKQKVSSSDMKKLKNKAFEMYREMLNQPNYIRNVAPVPANQEDGEHKYYNPDVKESSTSFKPEKRRKLKPGEIEIMKGRGNRQTWFYVKNKNDAKTLIRLGRNYAFPTGITKNNSREKFDKDFFINEGWSDKYKKSINCNNPKGFSQKAHCAGRTKRETIMNLKSLIQQTIKEVLSENEKETKVGNYETKYFHMCPGAKGLFDGIEDKDVNMDIAERSAMLQDALFFIEKHILEDDETGSPEGYMLVANNLATNIMAMAKMMGLEKEHHYIQGHIDTIKKALSGEDTKSTADKLGESLNIFFEENKPTNPSKWSYYKSQAKKKFDVYPSAYANAWAAKKYKAAGGGWRKG